MPRVILVHFAAPLRGARFIFGFFPRIALRFILHPSDEDLSPGTPVLGYYPAAPTGQLEARVILLLYRPD